MKWYDIANKYQKEPVKEYANTCDSFMPVVSVVLVTYNHIRFISDCIEGAIMQESNFPYEIILAEDESTDGTREVCMEYAKAYPNRIRLLLNDRKNNILINGKPSGKFNFLHALSKARGKYIAWCEGDDYWTDPLKLQKQVEFMEVNPDCTLCFHPSRMVFVNGNSPDQIEGPGDNWSQHIFSSEDAIARSLGIRTVSVVFASWIVNELPDWYSAVSIGDLAFHLICASKGKIGYIGGEPMSVYRRGVFGAWSEGEHNFKWHEKRLQDKMIIYRLFNEFSEFRYNKEVKTRVKRMTISYLLTIRDYCDKSHMARLMLRHISLLMDLRRRRVQSIWLHFFLPLTVSSWLKKMYRQKVNHLFKSKSLKDK